MTIKQFYMVVFFIFSFNNHYLYSKHAISYDGGSRFGDKISAYSQARYISYITKIQFLTRPFIYSNQLKLDFESLPYDSHARNYSQIFDINSKSSWLNFLQQIKDPNTPSTLYILHYQPDCIFEWNRTDFPNTYSLLFNYPWHNKNFSHYIKNCIRPNIVIPDFTKPNCLNVAVHVRTLSGGDTPETSWAFLPLKHPSLDYYERQIKKIYELNSNKFMHVFLFSDTDNSQKIIDHFRSKFNEYDIEFNMQSLINPDTNYVVQDFFAMQKFNILIATQSNFSMMAAKVGSFDMIIFPVHVKGIFPDLYIDRIRMINYCSDWCPYEIDVVLKD